LKNRNVIFIGFVVAAVLNTSGAFAAYSIASKDYVDALGARVGNGFDSENTVTAAIGGINTTLGTKANSADVYTKTETNGLLAAKADATDLESLSDFVATTGQTIPSTIGETTDIATVVGAINALNTKTSSMATTASFSELTTRVDNAETAIGNNSDAIDELSGTVGEHTTTIGEHTTAIAGLETAVDAKQDTLVATGNNANIVGSGSVTVSKDDNTGVITINGTDNDTTYALGTATTMGLTKLYTGVGTATDGTMTQNAIKTALDGKADSLPTQCTSESQFCVLTLDVQNNQLAWIEITNPFTEEE
jgi:hypothetical protein